MEGFDVSHYQGNIDWMKVPKDGPQGKGFAICKATQGTDKLDPAFHNNIQGALASGLGVGAYHFFDPKLNPKDQAAFFLSQLKPEYFPLVPVLDVEDADGWDQMSMDVRGYVVQDFLDAVQDQVKGRPTIYTYAGFSDANLATVPFSVYNLWLARYMPTIPKGWANYSIWQYASQGYVPGIQGPVDLDRLANGVTFESLTCPGK